MTYLLLGPNGSWRQWEVDALPTEYVKKYAVPDSPVRTIRYNQTTGKFEVLAGWSEGSGHLRWGEMADVALNGGVEGWVANCHRISNIESERLSKLVELALNHGYTPP